MTVSDELLHAGFARVSAKTLTRRAKKIGRSFNELKLERESFTYDVLKSSNGVRILRILDGAETDPIQCLLYEISLDDGVVYEALSYSWKIDTTVIDIQPSSKYIQCNGKRFKVQRNLYNALDRFRRMKRKKPIWVDAICINQKDLVEKDVQLRMMGRIYASASKVVVWLGTTSPVHEVAMTFMKKLPPYPENDLEADAASLESIDTKAIETIEAAGLEPREDPQEEPAKSQPKPRDDNRAELHARWFTVLRILRRGWFSRTWTLQEMLLPKEIVIYMGSREIPLDTIANASRWLLRFYTYDPWGWFVGLKDEIMQDYPHIVALPELCRARELFKKGERWPLERYISTVRTRGVTEPRDKVAAGVSLLKDVGELRKEADVNIPIHEVTEERTLGHFINHKRSTADIYTDCAMSLIHGEAGFFALSLVGDTVSTVEDLPSWVPDLMQPPHPAPLRHLGATGFQACTASAAKQKCTVSNGVLSLQAAELDKIRAIGESCWPWMHYKSMVESDDNPFKIRSPKPTAFEKFGAMFQLISELGKTYPHTNESTISVFWKTLIGGLYDGNSHPAPILQTSFREFISFNVVCMSNMIKENSLSTKALKLSKEFSMYHKSAIGIDSRFEPFVESFDSEEYPLRRTFSKHEEIRDEMTLSVIWEDPGRVIQGQPFMGTFEKVYDGRRLFITEKGYVGLGVESVEVGDSVVLVAGAEMPYVFRAAENQQTANPLGGKPNGAAETKVHTLVGEAYVHGMMHGEADKDGQLEFESMQLI